MHNKNYYLVSPRVDGVTIQGFIETMFEQHIVMMGWGTDNKIGADFNNLNKGDFVIVAQRVNWVFTYYFAGIIDDEQGFSNDDGILCRKLRSFIDLRGYNEDFLANASFASMSVIKAMININPSNNIEIIKKLDKIIAMQENKDYVNSFVSLLKSNHNLILTGAPGTGKTYLAKEIAKDMGAEWKLVQFHPSYDYTDFVEGLRPIKKGTQLGFERIDGVFKNFCKKALGASTLFSLTYKELVRELKTGDISSLDTDLRKTYVNENNHIVFKSTDGRTANKEKHYVSESKLLELYLKIAENIQDFEDETKITKDKCKEFNGGKEVDTTAPLILKELFKRSKKELVRLSKKPISVIIIDEINRGEISKIFGELFYSIDSGYRGTKGRVNTQYQNLVPKDDVFYNGFFVPENVYIIGTMNDIDRSVESMDFAMRRRFAWKEITAESRQSMLDDEGAWGGNKPEQVVIDEIKNRMNNLNACIIDKYGDEEPSPKDKVGLTKAYQIGASYFLKYGMYGNFEDLWTNHLEGLLYEYLRGTTNIEAKIERLQKAYNDTTEH